MLHDRSLNIRHSIHFSGRDLTNKKVSCNAVEKVLSLYHYVLLCRYCDSSSYLAIASHSAPIKIVIIISQGKHKISMCTGEVGLHCLCQINVHVVIDTTSVANHNTCGQAGLVGWGWFAQLIARYH